MWPLPWRLAHPRRANHRAYNLDVKNRHETHETHLDPAELLTEFHKAQAVVAGIRERLHQELESALLKK
jgi:hypothetical protein